MKYKVKLEKTDEGYAIWCPGLPGCWSQGQTEEEALENIKDAIQTYLVTVEDLNKDKITRMVEIPTGHAWPSWHTTPTRGKGISESRFLGDTRRQAHLYDGWRAHYHYPTCQSNQCLHYGRNYQRCRFDNRRIQGTALIVSSSRNAPLALTRGAFSSILRPTLRFTHYVLRDPHAPSPNLSSLPQGTQPRDHRGCFRQDLALARILPRNRRRTERRSQCQIP